MGNDNYCSSNDVYKNYDDDGDGNDDDDDDNDDDDDDDDDQTLNTLILSHIARCYFSG